MMRECLQALDLKRRYATRSFAATEVPAFKRRPTLMRRYATRSEWPALKWGCSAMLRAAPMGWPVAVWGGFVPFAAPGFLRPYFGVSLPTPRFDAADRRWR